MKGRLPLLIAVIALAVSLPLAGCLGGPDEPGTSDTFEGEGGSLPSSTTTPPSARTPESPEVERFDGVITAAPATDPRGLSTFPEAGKIPIPEGTEVVELAVLWNTSVSSRSQFSLEICRDFCGGVSNVQPFGGVAGGIPADVFYIRQVSGPNMEG